MPNRKVSLAPPPINSPSVENREWKDWFSTLHRRVGEGPLIIQGYSKATLPSAESYGASSGTDPFSSLIFVYDEVGGATLAFSDGTDWRRVQDRAIVA